MSGSFDQGSLVPLRVGQKWLAGRRLPLADLYQDGLEADLRAVLRRDLVPAERGRQLELRQRGAQALLVDPAGAAHRGREHGSGRVTLGRGELRRNLPPCDKGLGERGSLVAQPRIEGERA